MTTTGPRATLLVRRAGLGKGLAVRLGIVRTSFSPPIQTGEVGEETGFRRRPRQFHRETRLPQSGFRIRQGHDFRGVPLQTIGDTLQYAARRSPSSLRKTGKQAAAFRTAASTSRDVASSKPQRTSYKYMLS